MKDQISCEREHAAVKAVTSGVLSDEISGHIQSCVNCRDAVKVVSFFQKAVQQDKSQPKNLPAAGLIWWKSRLREKQRLTGRVTQPLAMAQTAAVVVALAAFIWLWQSGALQATVFGAALTRVGTSVAHMGVPILMGFIGFLIICTMVGFTLRRFMLEK